MSSRYKLHIHRWAKQRQVNVLTVLMAQTVAMTSDRLFDLMQWTRQGIIDAHLPPRPDRETWMALYRDHRRLTVDLANFMPGFGGGDDGQALQGMLDKSRAISTWSKNNPDELKAWLAGVGKEQLMRWIRFNWRMTHRLYRQHLRDMQIRFLKLQIELLQAKLPGNLDHFSSRNTDRDPNSKTLDGIRDKFSLIFREYVVLAREEPSTVVGEGRMGNVDLDTGVVDVK